MSAAKRGSLANMAVPKEAAASMPAAAPPSAGPSSPRAPVPRRAPGDMKTVQVRINKKGWKALRDLAADETLSLEALMVEALNDILVKNRLPPIVERRAGERGTEGEEAEA